MKKIAICFIAHTRQRYLPVILNEFLDITQSLKDKIKIYVLNDENSSIENENYVYELKQMGLDIENILLTTYFSKSQFIANVCTEEFVVKVDEDIYMSSSGWEKFLLSGLKLNWNEIGLHAPCITTGIPSVEYFLDNCGDLEFANYMRIEFANTHIPNLWGANYETLNQKYKIGTFFDSVNELDHCYKGIHPIRIRADLQKTLLDFCIQNKSWDGVSSELISVKNIPYFCNSVFMIQRDHYSNVIDGLVNQRFVFDNFDEVGLNQYIHQNDLYYSFDNSVIAVHPSYNTIGDTYIELSDYFFSHVRY